jgi:hypothetical protein
MTHDELLTQLEGLWHDSYKAPGYKALRAVVELHKPSSIPDWVPTKEELICWCAHVYPCPTIQAIEKELQ